MMIMTYSTLALLGRWTLMNSVNLVTNNIGLLNGVVIGGMLAGIVAQGKFDTWRATRNTRMKAKVMAGFSEEERSALKKASAAKAGVFGKLFKPKKAG
jgi:hypothetical protein